MTAEFNTIFAGGGGAEPGPPPPCCDCELVTNITFGARLLNCLLNKSVNPAPNPFTEFRRLLPAITIKIVSTDLNFLLIRASNENCSISRTFIFLQTLPTTRLVSTVDLIDLLSIHGILFCPPQ